MARRTKLYLIFITLLAAAAVCVAIWALFFRQPAGDELSDTAPPADINLLPTEDNDDEKLPQSQGGGSVNITYSNLVTISLADGTAAVRLENPSRSNQSMVFQAYIQDVLIAQSGTVPPGNQLTVLPLEENVSLQEGSYTGEFHMRCYDPETGEPAIMQTVIPITITVTP